MTIPYIPGWWDSISESATKLAGQLPSVIQPNNVAKKKFEQMVRENPMILDQLSNLDETQRAAFGKALGYTDAAQNPIMGMPEGETLKTRKAKASYEAGLTPDERKSYTTQMFGGKSQEEINRGRTDNTQKDTLFNKNVTNLDQTSKINDLKIREAEVDTNEKEQAKAMQDMLKIKFPADKINFGKFVDDFISQKAPTELIQRIQSDPTLGPAFKQYLDMYSENLKIRAQRDIASMRTPAERFMGLNFLQQDADNALNNLTKAQDELKNLPATVKFNQQSPEYINATANVVAARTALAEATSKFQKATEQEFKGKYGTNVFGPQKGVNTPDAGTAPTNENAKQQEILYIRSITDPQKKAAAIQRYKDRNKENFPG